MHPTESGKKYQILPHYFVVNELFLSFYIILNLSIEMNSESSRSHLILSIIIESTNKTTGSVLKGKV